jgi:hypothetical protein
MSTTHCNQKCDPGTANDPNRRQQAYDVRLKAAAIARDRPHPKHANNCEEAKYLESGEPPISSYSKGLRHDSLGDPDITSYGSMLHALQTRNPADFAAIQLGIGEKKLTNPQAGLAFDLQGPDTHAVTQPPAPRIDCPQNSSEMGELYWMALARDVHFSDYGTSTIVKEAIKSLNSEFSDFRGPKQSGAVTVGTVFRGIFPGETVGPYLSQFLLKGNADPRVGSGNPGFSARDGFISYGALKINQRRWTVRPGVDFLYDFPWWLDAQNGKDMRGGDAFDTTQRRFMRNLRDLANFVHVDLVLDAFYNAYLLLLSEPEGDQLTSTARPLVDREFPFDPSNPYLPPNPAAMTQDGFVTFGPIHALTLMSEAMQRGMQAVWFQKWFVHRRLRPEEFGGRLHNHLTGARTYNIDPEILQSLGSGLLSAHFPSLYGTFLLPQAFSEGAPTHPAYGAGHATGSGACATILKAFFDESVEIENPMVANADGTALNPLPEDIQLTVGGELNKLAGNIALGRNAAGVHWRSDYDQSLLLGERVALQLLQEQSIRYNEQGARFQLTSFEGAEIVIENGQIFGSIVIDDPQQPEVTFP